MNISQINTQGIYDAGTLCQDPDTKGFDLQAGQSWIYPTNLPVRDYQYNITQQALHKNTLVSLPTGLGKTFIAAVVMYNFHRWYPYDKVIFMAPTRPLVKQQMDACYNIMAIPEDVTAELTGTKIQKSRPEIWQNKRVFFITPQVLQNDLSIIVELGGKIKCLVFDEAHRAKGNHAYCEIIRKLTEKNKLFRVLALSATPGNSSKDVLEVMGNLLIAHLEYRNEESPDVKPYVFERALETVVVPLGDKLQQIKDQYIQVLEKYTKTLIQNKVIYGSCTNFTKGKIFMVMKEFKAKNSANRTANYGEIIKCLNICVTLYHAYETLVRCGLRAFLNFFKEHIHNPLLHGNVSLIQIMDDLQEYLGPDPEVQSLPDGTYAEIPESIKFGHPKFYQLRDILIAHFKNSDSSTRVIVFFEYRESATEAYALLTRSFPMIKPRVFVGQRSGVTQKEQINTVKVFREGTCNTLLSTCIGEEGLDVGEVDLIVCFDIANKSPIRMIQRMGRTGRKKEGRVVVLVTEGKEQQTLKDCLIYKNNLGNFATNSELLEQGKYLDNPKMIPSYIQPKCQKMFITVKKRALTKNSNLKDMFRNMSDGPKFSEDLEIVEIQERLSDNIDNFYNKTKDEFLQIQKKPKIDFSKQLEKQRVFQAKEMIKPSKQTEIFVTLLQFADSKRYNLPVEQKSIFSDFNQHKCLKQGDIRSMFAKPSVSVLSQEFLPSSQKFDSGKDVPQSYPSEFFEELSTYLSIQDSMKDTHKTWESLFACPKINYYKPREILDLSTFVVPDLSVLESITVQNLEAFTASLISESQTKQDVLKVDGVFDDSLLSQLDKLEEKMYQEKTEPYGIPRNFDSFLDSFRLCDDKEIQKSPEKVAEKSYVFETPNSFDKVLNLLQTRPVETKKVVSKNLATENYEELLSFFKVSSIAEFFEETQVVDLDKTIIYTPEKNTKISPNNTSPDLFEGSPDLFPSDEKQDLSVLTEESSSPILSTNETMQHIKAKKKLFEEKVANKLNLANLNQPQKSFFETTRNKQISTPKKDSDRFDISDICDLSQFFVNRETLHENQDKKKVEPAKAVDLEISDICDLSVFGLSQNNESTAKVIVNTEQTSNTFHNEEKKTKIDLSIDDLCDISQFFNKTKVEDKSVETETKNDQSFVKQLSHVNDIFDFSYFLSGSSGETSKKSVLECNRAEDGTTTKTQTKNLDEAVVAAIDLTDSDFELSPIKKSSEQVNKTQLSITKSFIAKSGSQKENTTPKTKKIQLSTNRNHSQAKQKCKTPKTTQKKIPKEKTSKFNISLAGDSDDEFQDPIKSPIFAKPKPVSEKKNKIDKPSSSNVKKKRKLFCEFLDNEAVVSDDEKIVISEDEDSGEDCFEASFVADETEDFLNNTTMHAKYLESVKSPVRGKFKIPTKPRCNVSNVFSQEVNDADDTYMNDSFCVGSQEVETCNNDLSELEILEMQLKEEKRNKKRKKSDDKGGTKKRRILVLDDDSDL
ncbi:Fanconi anemia group M protein [Tribolium madens]|uniref:Fanconi anemia group M protein n=1 Tax=Tribolium madens TaxID=41895 RepID=UPI001CF73CA7|nr:Fanconi anemia group M protein [Tribolium madens]